MMKKTALGILLILVAILLCSCSQTKRTTDGFDLCDCVVIYPDDSNDKTIESAENLASFLSKKTDTEIKARSDEYSGKANRITIGSGDSDYAKESTENLKSLDYVICTDGSELVLGAISESAQKDAINYFCDNYTDLTNDNVFSSEDNYRCQYKYPLNSLSINGKSIEEFSIVYPENKGTYAEKYTPEKYAAINLQNKISRVYGAILPLVATNDIPENSIVISSASGERYAYEYKVEDGKITVNAGGVFAYSKAFEKMLTAQGEKLDITGENKESNVMSAKTNGEFVYFGEEQSAPPITSLTLNGISIGDYVIIYPETNSANGYSLAEKNAAENMQKYIEFATGIKLKISDDTQEALENEILIGHTNRPQSELSDEFGDEEFIIKTEDGRLIINGGEKRGTLYGVFTFLENYVGYSFIAADTEILYLREAVEIPVGLAEREEPSYEFRDICVKDAQDEGYSIKRKLNSFYRRDLDYTHGGSVKFTAGLVHTFGTVFGVSSSDSQPCLSDEETYKTVLQRAKTLLKSDDTATIISVTQNDNNKYCTCAECSEINNEEGSTGGTQMRFINRLATELKEEFPNVRVLTLAYMYSIKPTKTKPADNVIVEYCPLESCCNHALDDFSCSENQKYYKYAEEWSQMTDNLYVWYYTTDFDTKAQDMPFMNFGAIYDNFKFFRSLGVKGIFCEGLINDDSCEFAVVRSYLMSRLMWDSNMSREEYNSYFSEFIRAYYGETSDVVMEYFNVLKEMSRGKHFNESSAAGALLDRTNLKVLSSEISDWFDKASGFTADKTTAGHFALLKKGFDSLLKKLS